MSENHEKYGWIVFENLKRKGFKVIPVNPKYRIIGGEACYPTLSAIPAKPDVVVLVVPPEQGIRVLEEAAKLGIKRVWCQPGAESQEFIRIASTGLKSPRTGAVSWELRREIDKL